MNAGIALAQAGFTGLLMVLSGYAVCGASTVGSTTRLLLAPVAGLALQLWSVSVINLASPLTFGASLLVLWPLAVVLLVPGLRRTLASDLRFAASDSRARTAAAGIALLAVALLVPLMTLPDLVFFDGTSNHDNFFWVVGAEYLQSNLYSVHHHASELPEWQGAVPPLLGFEPAWGRMGSEGWGAAMSGIIGILPIRWYVGGTTALVLPWVTTTLALARIIGWTPFKPSWVFLGCALQALPVFYILNGNLPNLLGILCGSGLLVATRMVVGDGESERRLGTVLIPLFLQGVLVAYPEIAPFVGLPAVLIVIAAWIRPPASIVRGRLVLLVLGTVVCGLLINPVTSWRAFHGFQASFAAARADGGWPNLFEVLSPVSYLPASLTLSIDLFNEWEPVFTAACTLLLLASIIAAWRCARDRWLAIASLSGFASLVAYTLVTDFSYGWQKASQFSGIALAAVYPFGVIAGWLRLSPIRLKVPGAAACCAIAFWAIVSQIHQATRIAAHKGITAGMLDLRDAPIAKDDGPVLVVGDTFRHPYFQGMWAVYLFPGTRVLCPEGAGLDGGYLSDRIGRFDPLHPPAHAAYYVGREWADAFCADLERVAQDRVYALLPEINHVHVLQGFVPRHDVGALRGVPVLAGRSLKLAARPVREGRLEIRLRATHSAMRWTGKLTVRTPSGEHSEDLHADANGGIAVHVPLTADVDNIIEVDVSTASPDQADAEHPFAVEHILLRSTSYGG